MAKFAFNDSAYLKIWNSQDASFLQSYIDESALLRVNNGFWRTQVTVNPDATKTQADGTATFTATSYKKEVAPMMDMRAPLGDSIPLDKEGIHFYSANIPDFIAPGFVEQAPEREYREKLIQELGNDANIINQWADRVQTLYDGGNATMSNMVGQLETTGKIVYNFGRGIKSPIYKAEIPAENFKKATTVWSDTTNCKWMDEVMELVTDYRDSNGYEGALVLKVPYDMFKNSIMKNAQVKDFIKQQRTYNDQATTSGMVFGMDEVVKYIMQYPDFPRIEVVAEKQKNLTWESATIVHGWEQNTAVLCPVGMVGKVFHTENQDKAMFDKYGASTVSKVWATIDTIFHLCNTTLNNGNYKEWHTDLLMSAVPALTNVPYHWIIKTNETA